MIDWAALEKASAGRIDGAMAGRVLDSLISKEIREAVDCVVSGAPGCFVAEAFLVRCRSEYASIHLRSILESEESSSAVRLAGVIGGPEFAEKISSWIFSDSAVNRQAALSILERNLENRSLDGVRLEYLERLEKDEIYVIALTARNILQRISDNDEGRR